MNHWSQLRFELHTTLLTGIVLISTGHDRGGSLCIGIYILGISLNYWRSRR